LVDQPFKRPSNVHKDSNEQRVKSESSR
jgi:hypothetical protein